MSDIIATLTAFLAAHKHLSGPFGFGIAFCGCMVGVSFLVPAGAIATAVGVLIGAGIVSWSFILWAILGATVGMSLSYALGLKVGPRLLHLRVVQAHPDVVAKVRRLFTRYGPIAILIGYFAGPPRALVSSLAAIAGMPYPRFLLSVAVSATIWMGWSVAMGAVPGTLLAPDSPWLLAVTLIAPVVTVVLTAILVSAAF